MGEAFWQKKSLAELSSGEWESLCDGCGKCCLQKLEDEDTREVYYTNVACKLLDIDTVRCKKYALRKEFVPDCLDVRRDIKPDTFSWLPSSCAYRCVHEGRDLPVWHHLVSGDRATVMAANASVAGKVISEEFIHPDEIEAHVVTWVDTP